MPGSPERQRESIISLGVEAERALRHRTLCNCGPGPWWPGLPRPAPPFWLTAIRMAARQPPSTSASYSTLRCRRPSALASRYSSLASRLPSLASRLSHSREPACYVPTAGRSVNHLSDSSVASLLVVRSPRSPIPFLSSNNRGSQLRFVLARRKDERSIRLGERATNPIGEKRCRGAAAVRGGREILSPDYYRSSMTRRMVGCRGQSARDTPTTMRRGSTEGHRGLDLRAL